MTSTFTHDELPSDAVLDALGASGFELGARTRSVRTVLDTFDGRLHAAGLRLEARGAPTAELVLSGGSGTASARLTVATTPLWPHELPAGPFRARLAAVTKERALLPVLTISSDVYTARRLDRRGKATVAIEVHDGPAVDTRSPTLPSWVAEVAPVAGHVDVAEASVTRLASLGFQPSESDLVTFLAAAAGVQLEGRSSSPTVPLDADDEALAGYRRVLGNLAATIDANLEGSIADIDPEFLHELRVAVRRTRSVLAQGKGVVPADVRDRYRASFGWLGEVTGPARDLDVYVLGWDDYVAPLSDVDTRALDRVQAEVEARRQVAHRELSDVLRSGATRDVLDSWRSWLTDPDIETTDQRALGPFVARRIAKAQATVLRDGRSIDPTSPAERLHDLRKDTKKLRYLLECFGGLFETKPLKGFVSQLKALQDNLGEHQDAEVHLGQLRELAHDLHERATVDTDALLAMGRLGDHLDRRRRHERDEFARRFAAYDTAANRKALDALLGAAGVAVKVVATYSIKGGVGKTSTAVNLAFEAARAGVRVLVWDLDPQGAATYLLRVRPKVRGGSKRLVSKKGELAGHVRGSALGAVHVVPADFSLRHLDLHLDGTNDPTARLARLLEPVRDDYDLALLDCPPGISLASESVFGAVDTLLVPVVPAALATRTLGQLTRFLADRPDGPGVLPVLSMVDRRRKLQRELVDDLAVEWPQLLPTAVPASAVIERMGLERAPVGVFAPSSAATRAYRAVWAEVASVLWPPV